MSYKLYVPFWPTEHSSGPWILNLEETDCLWYFCHTRGKTDIWPTEHISVFQTYIGTFVSTVHISSQRVLIVDIWPPEQADIWPPEHISGPRKLDLELSTYS